jgi:hypothetical protein
MEGSSSVGVAAGALPLPDEDEDSGLFIEAPLLPEPPEAADDQITFLSVDDGGPPPAGGTAAEYLPTPEMGAPHQGEPKEPVPPAPAVVPVAVEALAPTAPAKPQVPQPSIHIPQPSIKVPPPPAAKVDPLAGLNSLKLDAMRPAAKPKPMDHKGAISSLMGELTQVGRSGAPSVLRLEVPQEMNGQEIEVVVQLRHQGQVLVEGKIHRPAPGKGTTAKLSVEMKRS